MKKLLSPLIIIALSTMPCHAQFGTLSRIYKGLALHDELRVRRVLVLAQQHAAGV